MSVCAKSGDGQHVWSQFSPRWAACYWCGIWKECEVTEKMSTFEYVKELAPETESWAHEQLASELDTRNAEIERQAEVLESARGQSANLIEQNKRLRALVATLQIKAAETYRHWDAERDSKVGKSLRALAGRTGYWPDLDAAREAAIGDG
jgi:hypothetical protein